MATLSINGPQKAAILLYTLGEELAAEILKKIGRI